MTRQLQGLFRSGFRVLGFGVWGFWVKGLEFGAWVFWVVKVVSHLIKTIIGQAAAMAEAPVGFKDLGGIRA